MGSRSHPGGPLHRDSPPFAEEPSLSRWRPCRAHLVCRGAPVAVCTREPSLAAAAGSDPWVCHASHVGSMLPICMRFVLARACARPPLEWFIARAMCSRSPSGGPSLAAAAGRGPWVCHASHVGSMLSICMRFVLARACARIAWLKVERQRNGATLNERRIARHNAERKRNGATLDAHRNAWPKAERKRNGARLDAHRVARLKAEQMGNGVTLYAHRISRLKGEQKRNGATLDAHRIVWLKAERKRNGATLDAHRIARLKAEMKRNGATLNAHRIARLKTERKRNCATLDACRIARLKATEAQWRDARCAPNRSAQGGTKAQ